MSLSKKQINAISIICASIFMALLCFACPYLSDDWHFKFVFNTFNPDGYEKRVGSFKDIMVSMSNYYNISGGRVFAHFLLYVVDIFGKPVFNILNSVIFAVFGYMILCLIERCSGKAPSFMLPLIYVSMIMFLPTFGDSAIWQSGAVNYLWMSSIITAFLLYTLKYFRKANPFQYTVICVLAFLCGAANEISGGMAIVLLASFYITRFVHISKKQLLRLLPPLICLICGTLIVILAPGNAGRAAAVDRTEIFNIQLFFEVLPRIILWYAENYLSLTAVILLANLFFWDGSRSAHCSVSFFIAGIAGCAALPLSGTFIERAAFLPIVFVLIAFFISAARLYRILKNCPKVSHSTAKASICFGCIMLMFIIYMIFRSFSFSASITAFVCYAAFMLFILAKSGRIKTESIKKLKSCVKPATAVLTLCVCLYIGKDLTNYFPTVKQLRGMESQVRLSAAEGNENIVLDYDGELRNFSENIFIPRNSMNAYKYAFSWESLYYGIKIYDKKEFEGHGKQ